jgi:palmitoyltransferase
LFVNPNVDLWQDAEATVEHRLPHGMDDHTAEASASDAYRGRQSLVVDESQHVKTIRRESQIDQTGASSTDEQVERTAGPDADKGIPSCLLDCRDAVEACSHRAQAWADAQNEKAERKQRQRRERADGGVHVSEDGTVVEPKGESFLQRKGIVFVVFVILTWVYLVYVWRICANGIRQTSNATPTRSEAIGLLVAFNVLWLWTMWSYVKVIMTPPGYVRDEFAIVEAPKSPKLQASNGEKEIDTSFAANPMHAPTPFLAQSSTMDDSQTAIETVREQSETAPAAMNGLPGSGSVDSTLAAALGPIGVGLIARADEQETVQRGEGITEAHAAPPPHLQSTTHQPEQQPTQQKRPSDNLPEPLRLPQTAFPLHELNTYCYRCKRVKPPRSHHCRHCGTCVLKMDHHCPWVGGCVGARNHKFFYNFLQSVTVLETFVLISNAIMFRRGVARGSGWTIDGYMISLFPIASMFFLFTFALLITHSYMFVMNLSTIEHMSYERQKVRENILIENWSEERARLDERPKPGFFAQMRERDAMKKRWATYWGKPKSEANLWWLDGSERPPRLMVSGGEASGDPAFTPRLRDGEGAEEVMRPRSWYHGIGANWRQAMGKSPFGWFLPVGRGLNADGTMYAANWRFGPLGEWTPREQWISRLTDKPQA